MKDEEYFRQLDREFGRKLDQRAAERLVTPEQGAWYCLNDDCRQLNSSWAKECGRCNRPRSEHQTAVKHDGDCRCRECMLSRQQLHNEAADEINRLRAALQNIKRRYIEAVGKGEPATGDLVVELANYAAAALPGLPDEPPPYQGAVTDSEDVPR
jgi:hypothetical protein